MDGNGFDLTERISVAIVRLVVARVGKCAALGSTITARVGCPGALVRTSVPIPVRFARERGRIVDVALGSGADVCANSGPFRQRNESHRRFGTGLSCRAPVPDSGSVSDRKSFLIRWAWLWALEWTSVQILVLFASESGRIVDVALGSGRGRLC